MLNNTVVKKKIYDFQYLQQYSIGPKSLMTTLRFLNLIAMHIICSYGTCVPGYFSSACCSQVDVSECKYFVKCLKLHAFQ